MLHEKKIQNKKYEKSLPAPIFGNFMDCNKQPDGCRFGHVSE